MSVYGCNKPCRKVFVTMNMTEHRLRILCVHQGAELYGSDRSFLQVVESIRRGWPNAHLRVILAADGPLRALLEKVADEVVIRNLCVLRLANPISTISKGTIGLPYFVGAALREIRRADLVYINTTVIADYMIAARFYPRKCVIHVREIPKSKAMPVVRCLVRESRARIIYNSHATEHAFALPARQPQTVIHNGVAPVAAPKLLELPQTFSRERPLRIAMLGRISDWKGQDLLIDSAASLAPQDRERLAIRIVGSTFGNAIEPNVALQLKIDAAGLTDYVTLEPFKDDPTDVYLWSDICAVPSRLPEPFGRVAVEAMSHARPVIAAGHGGLVEIVNDKADGWLFTPNDTQALATAIKSALDDPSGVATIAEAALKTFLDKFSSETMSSKICATLESYMNHV